MRTLRQLHWVTMLLITFGFYSCERLNPEEQDKDDVIVEEQSWTVHIKADIGNEQTKALELVTGGIKATWTENDPVYVFSRSGLDVDYKGLLHAESAGTSTTFSGEIIGTFSVNDQLYLYYPKIEKEYRNQKGTLQYISDNCDFALALVKVLTVDAENKILTTESANFTNQIIIWKLRFMDGDNAVKVKKMDFYSQNAQLSAFVGSNWKITTSRLTVELDEAAEDVFICFEKSDNAADTYSFVLFDESGNYYDGSKTVNKALEHGKYYKSTVNVDKHAQILIGTAAELSAFATTVNNQTKQNGQPGYDDNRLPYYNVKLTADIDCSSLNDFPGIGYGLSNSNPIFNGVFDGDGHTISNLSINQNRGGVGFLGQFRGTVRNLTLQNCSVSGTSNVGGLVGYVRSNIDYGESNVENCHFTGASASVTGTEYNVGGLIGSISQAFKVESSSFSGTVSAQKSVGGIIGYTGSAYATSTVSNCTAAGSVSSTGAGAQAVAGGIIGNFYQALGMATIMNCANNASVTAANVQYAIAGGIIGYAWTNKGKIYHCTNNGTITGNKGSENGQMCGTIYKVDSSSDQNFTIENE